MNHCILRTLGVSCPEIEDIVSISSRYGFAAKLTGGGGGGCVIAIARDSNEIREDELICELKANGFDVHRIRVGGEGVLMEYS